LTVHSLQMLEENFLHQTVSIFGSYKLHLQYTNSGWFL